VYALRRAVAVRYRLQRHLAGRMQLRREVVPITPEGKMTKTTNDTEQLLAQHVAIVGKTGSGKSYTAKGYVERLLDAKRRVCIIDPTGVWWGLRSSADGKRAGYPVAVFGGAHADVPIAATSGPALAAIIATKNLPAIIDLSEMLIGDRHRFMTEFAEALYRDNRTPLYLVIDEADEFAPQNPLPETKRMLHHVDRIVRRGRVRGFRITLITQRPAVLHKNVLTQSNALIAMRLTAPQDRKALQAWVEGNGDAVRAKAVLDSLASLKRGEGWVWAPELGILERRQFPKITTFDSGRTPEDGEAIAEPSRLASVDLGEVRASFEEAQKELRTVKDLQADNKRLRAEVEVLKRKPTPAKASAPAPAPAPHANESPTVTALRQELAAVTHERNAAQLVLNGWHDRARKVAKTLLEAVGDVAIGTKQPAKLAAAVVRHEVRREAAAPAPGPVGDGLSGPEQRVLDAIAWMEGIGIAEPELTAVAFLAEYSPNTGAFNNTRGRLRQRGLIEYLPGSRMVLTDSGRTLANKPEAIGSNEELHERIYGRLGGPERRVLAPLIAAYPNAMASEEVARAAAYAPGTGAFNNVRGRLRTLGLVDYPQQGMMVARPMLFPKGAA
jgi:ABC-type dipeptide/oligopeptide/nickel transport system ATPase component